MRMYTSKSKQIKFTFKNNENTSSKGRAIIQCTELSLKQKEAIGQGIC